MFQVQNSNAIAISDNSNVQRDLNSNAIHTRDQSTKLKCSLNSQVLLHEVPGSTSFATWLSVKSEHASTDNNYNSWM